MDIDRLKPAWVVVEYTQKNFQLVYMGLCQRRLGVEFFIEGDDGRGDFIRRLFFSIHLWNNKVETDGPNK